MKRNTMIGIVVLAFAVVIAGAAFARTDRNEWCTGNPGWGNMTGSHMGTMSSSGGHGMGSMGTMMGSSAGHMTGSVASHMTARQEDGKVTNECPGRNSRSGDARGNGAVDKDAGN